jgi:hypothetical protein
VQKSELPILLRIAYALRAYQRHPLIYVSTSSHHRSRIRQEEERRRGGERVLVITPVSGGHRREPITSR